MAYSQLANSIKDHCKWCDFWLDLLYKKNCIFFSCFPDAHCQHRNLTPFDDENTALSDSPEVSVFPFASSLLAVSLVKTEIRRTLPGKHLLTQACTESFDDASRNALPVYKILSYESQERVKSDRKLDLQVYAHGIGVYASAASTACSSHIWGHLRYCTRSAEMSFWEGWKSPAPGMALWGVAEPRGNPAQFSGQQCKRQVLYPGSDYNPTFPEYSD